MSYQNYEFTAFAEADLLSGGDHNLGCGDTFTMPGAATVCFEVRDNDSTLSGDNWSNENANDRYGQTATIEGEDGEELGNGGQIYAEKYFWVCDTDGNWYVMIEIEQEGSNDDYFTFYTGGHYTAPEPGTELTVYSQCNVRGCWVDYKCLDAGEKEATGSISGTVFCDVDCDGINGGVEVIPGCDYTIEAEDMWGWGFNTVHGSQASGGELVRLNCLGGDGLLCTTFNGKEGVYDVKIRVQDENDGQSLIKLKVNGVMVEAIRLDGDSDGGGSNNGGFSTYVIKDVDLSAGDDISIAAWGDAGEYVRIDNIVLEGHDQEVRTEEPVKEGVTIKLIDADTNEVVATTETDADGNYAFDDVPVGNYKIMGVAPDGTEFTIQDAGSDDSIDSDVDASGTSGVISVTANSETDIDLGLKEEKEEFRECDDPDAVNIGFEGFAAGVVISDQYDGVTISAQRDRNNTAENDAMVFDSNNPTGGDTDLATTSQGNILIISEDNDSSDPDDAIGGEIVFTFDNPSFLYDIKVVDTEEGGTITVVLEDGSTQSFAIPQIGDGDVAQVLLDVDGVVSMTIVLNGSGAIDDLCYVPGAPELGSLSGRYFCDTNDDALDTVNNSEPGVEGILVTLLDANGNPVLDGGGNAITTRTGDDGSYSFEELEAGTYGIKFTDTDGVTVGKELVAPNQGNNDAIDSDATGTATMSTISGIVVAAGEDTPNNDAAIVKSNDKPTAKDDSGIGCADEDIIVDFSDNFSDGDSASVSVTMINGQSINAGGPAITLANGVEVTLTVDDQFVFNGEDAYSALDIGESDSETFTVKVEDSDGAFVEASIDVTFKGDANSMTSLIDSLPDTATIQLRNENSPSGSSDEAFTIRITNGDDRIDGIFTEAYCVSFLDDFSAIGNGVDITTAPSFEANIYFADETLLPTDLLTSKGINGEDARDNLDLINWIINQDFLNQGYTDAEIQGAVWALTDGEFLEDVAGLPGGIGVGPGAGDAADAQIIVDLAIANGEGFTPGQNDLVGIIVDPTNAAFEQPFIYGLRYEDIDCIC